MSNYIANYRQIQRELKSFDKFLEQKDIENFTKHLNEKLANFKPTLMIYGTYNVGKSTFLNALFGQELTKTGDAPETKEIHEYNLENMKIFDTPGLNAKDEDDFTTDEQLKKSDIVIFLMSTDSSFEQRYVYKKIEKVMQDKKPIMIVLNNKSNTSDEDILRIKDKIYENISNNILDVKNPKERVSCIEVIDAKLAFEGKMQNNKPFIKNSNILKVEQEVQKIFKQSSEKEIANSLNIFIQDYIDKISTSIDSKLSNLEIKKTQELITKLQSAKSSLENQLKNLVDKDTSFLSNQLLNQIMNTSDKAQIENFLKNFTNSLNEKLTQILKQNEASLKETINIYLNEIQELKFSNSNFESSYDDYDYSDGDNLGKNIGDILKTSAPFLGPWGVVVGVIGTFVGAIFGGSSSRNDSYNREQEAKADAYEAKARQAKSITEQIINDLRSKYEVSIDEIVDKNYTQKITDLQNELEKHKSDESEFNDYKKELIKISNKVLNIS